jgi:hypothetical protein
MTHPYYSGITYGDLHARQLNKEKLIRRGGYELISVWTCEIEAELKTNKRMRDFFDPVHWQGLKQPIKHSREAYYSTVLKRKHYDFREIPKKKHKVVTS